MQERFGGALFKVSVDAGSGGTELEILSNIEQLKVDAGSGGVTVRLPASLSAQVDIETGRGGIDTDFAVQVTRVEQRHMVGRNRHAPAAE